MIATLCKCVQDPDTSPCCDWGNFIACLCAEDGISSTAGKLLPS